MSAEPVVTPVGTRAMQTFYVDGWKVTLDPVEGSTSCECPDHTAYVLDMLTAPRCEHAAAVWREVHAGGLLG